MRALLRNLDTGLLFKAPGQWVQSPFEATDFADPEAAHETALALSERNLEIFTVDSGGRAVWGRRIEK
jgi:hypothetical protein